MFLPFLCSDACYEDSMSDLKRIGIVGCGAIGGELARSICAYFQDRARLIVVSDRNDHKANALSNELSPHPDVLPLESVPFHCDLIIEAASPEACRELVPKALDMGRDVMVMSVGGLLEIYRDVFYQARSKNAHIYIPSGEIAGIDGLEAAMTGGVDTVRLTCKKPFGAFTDSAYVAKKGLRLAEFTGETILFEGNATEAIAAFPFHANVAATLSFAGLGPERTQVRMVTGPQITSSIQELEVEGAFGKMMTRTENQPSPQNPGTSYLAALSACAMLNEILNPVQIGT